MTRVNLPILKARLRLSSIISECVKLTRRGGDWWGICPFHSEKTGSFSVNDAKGFFHCFGCGAHGDVLDWWRLKEGLLLPAAVDRLKQQADGARAWQDEARPTRHDDTESRRKRDQARAIWQASQPISGTVAETYLRSARAIRLALPESLRFHPGLPIAGDGGDLWPAMVASVCDPAGRVIAIQRTFLARDGSSKARIDSPKRSLGALSDGAVRLGEPAQMLGIAEGIETGLSAMQRFLVPVWCALGSNLARIALPDSVRDVVIFADRGEAGEEAAEKARISFRSRGRRVAIRFPSMGKTSTTS